MSFADDMSSFDPPTLFKKIVCVSNDPALTATVCSAIGESGEYVTVVRRPREWHPTVRARDFGQYANTIAKVRPALLLLLCVDSATVEQFRSRFGDTRIVAVETQVEALLALKGLRRAELSGILRCRPDDLGSRLLLAKRLKRQLVVDESATPIADVAADSERADHAVVIDDDDQMSHVVAANYAFSIGADLLVLPPRKDNFREAVYAAIDARYAHRGTEQGHRAENALRELEQELRPLLDFGRRRFVTFITNGFPYGYFYRAAPTTHLFSSNLCNIIVSGIYWARYAPSTVCALLIDPGHFRDSETDEIATVFRKQSCVVVEVRNERATVQNARLLISGLPYDFLFICSHCGEVGGTRIAVRMPDQQGVARLVEFDTVMAVASDPHEKDGTEVVLLNELFIPVAVDGTAWFSLPGDMRTHFWKFLQSQKEPTERDVVRRDPVARVAHSTAIKLHDGNLLLNMMQDIDVSVSPIVFNNSCVSFFDAAQTLTHAGARGYIGTLAPVDDQYAREIAKVVIGGAECRVSFPLALHRAQAALGADGSERIYIHVGCHFNRLSRRNHGAVGVHAARIRQARLRWLAVADRASGYERDHALELAEFLGRLTREAGT